LIIVARRVERALSTGFLRTFTEPYTRPAPRAIVRELASTNHSVNRFNVKTTGEAGFLRRHCLFRTAIGELREIRQHVRGDRGERDAGAEPTAVDASCFPFRLDLRQR
jgi:hypothetical protein